MAVIMLFVLGVLAGVAGDQLADSLGHLWRVGGYVGCLLLWAIAIKVDTDRQFS